jgi:hypothetical protein
MGERRRIRNSNRKKKVIGEKGKKFIMCSLNDGMIKTVLTCNLIFMDDLITVPASNQIFGLLAAFTSLDARTVIKGVNSSSLVCWPPYGVSIWRESFIKSLGERGT